MHMLKHVIFINEKWMMESTSVLGYISVEVYFCVGLFLLVRELHLKPKFSLLVLFLKIIKTVLKNNISIQKRKAKTKTNNNNNNKNCLTKSKMTLKFLKVKQFLTYWSKHYFSHFDRILELLGQQKFLFCLFVCFFFPFF